MLSLTNEATPSIKASATPRSPTGRSARKSKLFLLTVAGHMDVTMMKKYSVKAASVSAKFGTPRPPLSASVLGGA